LNSENNFEVRNMKIIAFLSLALLSGLLLLGCAQDTAKTSAEDLANLKKPPAKLVEVNPNELANNMITVTGTIIFKNIEGGILGLNGNDGNKYTPRNLKPKYRRPGLVLEITGTINEDLLSFKQYGRMLEVKSVKIIDDSNVGRNSNEY
jgi:hypothetical protein